MIADAIKEINALVQQMRETGKLDQRVLAVAVEANQRYIEYLDELEVTFSVVARPVIVKVNNEIIKFNTIEEIATWITSL